MNPDRVSYAKDPFANHRLINPRERRLSRTHKDSARQRTRRVLLEVLKNADGSYEVFFNGEHVRSNVPEQWLNAELCVRYGFCGEEYERIIQQLSQTGKAVVQY